MYKEAAFLVCFLHLPIAFSLSGICPKGYFSSSLTACTPCPPSTFKDYVGPALSCTSCPSNSGHSRIGSTSVADCKCFTGYMGNPEMGQACQIRHCAQLSAPSNGAFVGVCNTAFHSVCRINCHEGYEATSGVERQCIVDLNDLIVWSGSPLRCEVIRCPVLVVPNANPPSGICTQSDLTYQTRCTFTCRTGYQLKGSKERVCQLDKLWSGTPTSCEEIHCPKLTPTIVATVSPSECIATSMRYASQCLFNCPQGYSVKGEGTTVHSRALTCQLDGTWNAEVPKCHDFQPPTMTCPSVQIEGITTKGKPTGKVSWKVDVTDNSVSMNHHAKINVSSSHEPLQELPIGATDVRVNAIDCAGNIATCVFGVVIRDIEAPTFSFCPGDIVQEELTGIEVRVNWDRPVFSDNSGVPVHLTANRQSGSSFVVPSTSEIEYHASDNSGNTNKNCSFRIILKKKTCPIFSPPRNGALACIITSGDAFQCAVMCGNGNDFVFNPPLLYFCASGKWNFWTIPGQPFDNTLPWSNCSATADSSWLKGFNYGDYYYVGDAHDPNVQEVVKQNFYNILTSPFVPPFFCSSNPDCTKGKITVSPGVVG